MHRPIWIDEIELIRAIQELIDEEESYRDKINVPYLCLESVGYVRGLNRIKKILEEM